MQNPHGIFKIELGGKQRILKFNGYALIAMGMVLKCDPINNAEELNKIAQKNPIRAINVVIHSGIMGYLEENAIYDQDCTIQEVAQWVQDANMDDIKPLWDAFTHATGIADVLAAQAQTVVPEEELAEKKNQ